MAAIAIVLPDMASPQERDGRVTIGIILSDGIDGSSRLYAERDHLEYSVTVGNESRAAISVNQDVLRRVFAIRVESEGIEIPVDVRWPDEVAVQDSGGPGVRYVAWQHVPLNPSEFVRFRLRLQRQDRPRFEEARYDVVFTVSGFETAIHRADGTPWHGITNASGTILRGATIQRPRNAEEQLAAHLADASLALRRGDRQGWLEALLKASAVEPGNGYVRQRLGLAYLGLGRYQEAVQVYESLIAGIAVPGRMIARDLAKAYLGVRDEGNAIRVLRMSGVSEEAMRDELKTLRSGLR